MSKNKIIVITLLVALGACCCAGFIILGAGGLFLSKVSLGIADCGWDDTALAWIDENQNGVWDDGEKPLAEVQFIADDIRHDYDTSNEAISDLNGEAWVSVFPVDCTGFNEIDIIIKAIPPAGYLSTTPNEISIPQDAAQNAQNDNFFFGFIHED